MRIVFVAAISALLLAPGPARAASKTLVIDGTTFSAGTVTLKKGDRLTVVNRSGLRHFVWGHSGDLAFDLRAASDSDNQQSHRPGESRSITLTRPGRYRLGCALHQNMNAWIVVEE